MKELIGKYIYQIRIGNAQEFIAFLTGSGWLYYDLLPDDGGSLVYIRSVYGVHNLIPLVNNKVKKVTKCEYGYVISAKLGDCRIDFTQLKDSGRTLRRFNNDNHATFWLNNFSEKELLKCDVITKDWNMYGD